MKKFENYKIVLGITLIFIFVNLYVVLYQGRTELPNDSWSKEILIESVQLPEGYNAINNDDIELLKLDEFYYLVYFLEDSFYLNQYNINFDLIDSTKIEKKYSSVDNINVYINEINNLHINFLENTKLHNLNVNLDGELLSDSVDEYNVQKVKYYGSDLLYSKYNTIYLNHKKIIKLDEFIDLTFIKKDDAFYISYINLNTKTLLHEINTIKVKNGNILNSRRLKDFALKTSTFIIGLDSTGLEDKMAVMAVIHDEKKNEFFNDSYKFSYNLGPSEESRKNSQGFQFSYTGKKDTFIQKNNTPIDIRDISTSNKVFPNIVMSNNDREIKLTGTKRFPNKTNYYTFNNGDHLLFSQLKRNEELYIYVASTAPVHIEKSQILHLKDYLGLFFSTLISFFPLFIIGQTHSLLFLVPFLLIVVPFTFIKLNWAEWNPNKILTFSILLFLLSKTIYLVFFINTSALPLFLQDTLVRLFIAYLFSGISIYSMIKYSGPIRNHFYTDFFTFFAIDIVTFTLFFSPYTLL